MAIPRPSDFLSLPIVDKVNAPKKRAGPYCSPRPDFAPPLAEPNIKPIPPSAQATPRAQVAPPSNTPAAAPAPAPAEPKPPAVKPAIMAGVSAYEQAVNPTPAAAPKPSAVQTMKQQFDKSKKPAGPQEGAISELKRKMGMPRRSTPFRAPTHG